MFIGHYAAAFIGASMAANTAPRVKLWQAFIAVQLIDFIWAALILLGVERGRIVEGFTAVNPLDLHHMPYSHSLLFCVIWAVIGGIGFKVLTRAKDWLGGVIFGALVLSHWFTDLIVHVPDLPLWPGSIKLGFGLWQNFALSMAVEIGLLWGAVMIYLWRREGVARRWIVGLALAMTALQLMNVAGPLPQDLSVVAGSGLMVFTALVLIAAWVERRATTA